MSEAQIQGNISDVDSDDISVQKTERQKLTQKHPVTFSKDPLVYPFPNLEAIPADYDPEVYRLFSKASFAREFDYWYWKEGLARDEADEYKAEGDACKSGDGTVRVLRNVEKMAKNQNKLIESLLASGKYSKEDLKALLANSMRSLD